jgi:hypothetical protein
MFSAKGMLRTVDSTRDVDTVFADVETLFKDL